MIFSLSKSIEILQRTPDVIIAMVQDVSTDWTLNNEGGETWSVYDIVGHLIHGEKTEWVPRMEIILSDNLDKTFEPFDRLAQFENSKGKSLPKLLEEFKDLRQKNIELLLAKNLTDSDFEKTGSHPVFGDVTLSLMLST